MGRKSKFSAKEKEQAVLEYKDGIKSSTQLCHELGLYKGGRAILEWTRQYDKHGIQAFIPKDRNTAYSKEFKVEVVQAYLNGEGSQDDLAIRFDVSSRSMISQWVLKYNSHEELEDYDPKGEVYMTKSRKTTVAERKKIVEWCMTHNQSYKHAAEQFDVSYTQVYQWVKKYTELGDDGLLDKRGKHKTDEELDEVTLLRRENERLKHKLEEKDRIEILLKKVQENERRRYSPTGNKNRNTKQ